MSLGMAAFLGTLPPYWLLVTAQLGPKMWNLKHDCGSPQLRLTSHQISTTTSSIHDGCIFFYFVMTDLQEKQVQMCSMFLLKKKTYTYI